MVNKELVESRKRTNPANAEEPDRRTGPDPLDQPRELVVLGQSRPTLLGEPLKGAGQNEAWASKDIAFSHHEVGGDVVSSPTLEQGGNRWTEFVKEITQLTAFLRVERNISHAARAYGPSHGGPAHARRAVGGQRHQTPNSGVDRSPEGRPAAPAAWRRRRPRRLSSAALPDGGSQPRRPCRRSKSMTKRWPSSLCCPGSTTTSPGKSPRPATGSVGCSPRSTPRSNASWDTAGSPGRAGPAPDLAHPSCSHRSREDQGTDTAAQKGAKARRPAHRGDLRCARRSDGRSHRHERRRPRIATTGRATRGAAPTTRRGRQAGRGTRGGAPSFKGPDHHAGRRGQDLRTDPH